MKIGYFVDWLEVYCLERKGLDMVDYLRKAGYKVEEKPYGTRVYKQILEVSAADGRQLFTVTRCPLSVKDAGRNGILPSNACHIKIHNQWCYQQDVGSFFIKCADACNVTIKSISRVDICADFQYFYNGMDPGTLLRGFLKESYLKINQPRFSVYGTSEKGYNIYNGASFGSKNSNVFTRFYCKSVEMEEVKQKNWIIDCWRALGFNMERRTWRVEFQIVAPGRKNIDRKTAEVREILVSDLCSQSKIRALFLSMAKRYFVFTKAGTATRKYNQEQLVLFDPAPEVEMYQPMPAVHSGTTNRTVKSVYNFLKAEALKSSEYSTQDRFNFFRAAEQIGIHHSLRQWMAWQDVNKRGDMPIVEPVKNPFTQVQGDESESNESTNVSQKEIW